MNQLQQIFSLLYDNIPGSRIIFLYIKDSYQNDPIRIVLELFLIVFALKYLFSKKYAPDDLDSKTVKLTDKEVEELINEWKPEPLVSPMSAQLSKELASIPVIKGPVGPRVKLVNKEEEGDYLNLSSFDFLALSRDEDIHKSTVDALRKYGVGACGPPGFYGTIDVHLQLESELAKFLGTEEAIIYSQAFSTISSVIPAFSKRGDILVCDDGINFSVQKGVQISRSTVLYYKHNDMNDLERVLKEITASENSKKKLTRRFIVFEGLSQNHGDIAPLPKIVELKKKYKFRIIVDETLSFGVLGKRGAGLSDHYNLPATEIDIISSSMAHALGSGGGFCAGSKQVVDHQRLSGLAYCFSAAIPALLAVAAIKGLNSLVSNPSILSKLRENIKVFRTAFGTPKVISISSEDSMSPVLHLRLKQHYNDREREEDLLQRIVEKASSKHLLLTRAKYVISQETNPPKPSIRVTVTAGHTPTELESAAKSIRQVAEEVLGAK